MEDMVSNGTLFMNTLKYFQANQQEDKPMRFDKYEGVDEIYNTGFLGFSSGDDDKNISFPIFTEPVQFTYKRNYFINLYCLYAVGEIDGKMNVDSKCFQFGDTAVIIYNLKEFYRRIENAFEINSLRRRHGFVTYIDEETYNGSNR
jgi:hypothetical protein